MTIEAEIPGGETAATQAGAVLFAANVDALARFYVAALGFVQAGRGTGFVVLERGGFELVVHAIRGKPDAGVPEASPPRRRTEAPVKLVFVVADLEALRSSIEQHGGLLDDPAKAWCFRGLQVIDAQDPEGNVIQLRAGRR